MGSTPTVYANYPLDIYYNHSTICIIMNDKFEQLIDDVKRNVSVNELALGYLRYETLRLLTARQFSELCARNLKGENFDDMVDGLVVERQI